MDSILLRELPPLDDKDARSDDSECSYDSDGFYLESLDDDPFEDIRVSIDKINKTSSMNCESGFGQTGRHTEIPL
ncbi:hypothetical protein LguiB_012515 [Lonicera macranthoides]